MDILKIVKKDIINNRLIGKGDRVLVALSGGSDSVTLLHILLALSEEMGFFVSAAHVNHNIREQAKSDEEFVRKLCKKLDVQCYVKSVDVPKYAKEKGLSCELAGRQVRYEFFEDLKEKYSFEKIATAHNKNDSCESILLHFIRGSGPDGLAGIPIKRNDCIIRPILNITKKEIEQYCVENKLEFVVDETNFTTDYTRNKIRLELIPMIEREFNSGFVNTVTENAKIFRETSQFLEGCMKRAYERVVLNEKASLDMLKAEENIIIRLIIQQMYCEFLNTHEKLSNSYTDKILALIKENKTQKTVNLPNKISARIEHGYLFFEKTENENMEYSYNVIENKPIYIKEWGHSVVVSEVKEYKSPSKDEMFFYLTDDAPLILRSRQKGDKFMPIGMSGTKKLSDLFCDLKISTKERNKIPLLVQNGNIIWVLGIRGDRRFQEGKRLMSCRIFREEN